MATKPRKDRDGSFSATTKANPAFVHPGALDQGKANAGHPVASPWTGDALDSLLQRYFVQTGFILRCSPDGLSGYWIKCGIRTAAWPRHYLLVHATLHVGFCGGVAILCNKIQAMLDGHLRPSPDVWEGE